MREENGRLRYCDFGSVRLFVSFCRKKVLIHIHRRIQNVTNVPLVYYLPFSDIGVLNDSSKTGKAARSREFLL